MTTHRNEMLAEMGVDVWLPRSLETSIRPLVNAASLAELAATVAKCTRCELHQHRTQTVFGTGAADASWLIVGEAPGAEEDRGGEPFVGRAGQLLTAMLRSIGLVREQVFIANVLKCRPPNNRDPKENEVAACAEYLSEQIRLIKPAIILAVGRVAAQNLLKKATPISKMRGQRYTYGEQGIPVVVTYHPAYLLRSPQEKRKTWQDLNFAKKLLEGS
ncbi:MAG: uracil-DNA glycosylase family 4 [Gammaproteobacteria bacterium]|jgi:uracil-DNA glycosylase family 4